MAQNNAKGQPSDSHHISKIQFFDLWSVESARLETLGYRGSTVFIEQNLGTSEPEQFKPVLSKD